MSNTATTSQITLFTRLTNEIAALDPTLAEPAKIAQEQFPARTVAEASIRITRAIETVKALKLAAPVVKPAPVAPVFHVHPGIYTVVSPEGRRTFKVEVQASDAEFAPGKVIVSFLSGQDNDGDYTGFAFLIGSELRVWGKHKGATELIRFAQQLVADPDAALVAKHCARCGRTLTVPSSIASGYGPECGQKGLR